MGLNDNTYISRLMRNHVQLGLCINTSVSHSNVFSIHLRLRRETTYVFTEDHL